MRARSLAVALLVLLLPACGGLPLPRGVQSAGDVRDQQAPAGVKIVAPGPQPGMTPLQLVTGYLYALSVSPEDDRAIARSFLAPGVECCDGGDVVVYRLPSRSISVSADPEVVDVALDSVGRVQPDGSYRLEDVRVRDRYRVTRVDGQLRLAEVPQGLRLLEGDLERSLTPYDVHFLGRTATGEASARLVPDRVFLPATAEPAQALVEAVLGPGTARLRDAVRTAAPPGTRARTRVEGGGVVVDLSAPVRDLDPRDRQRLSAQLVWTLVPTYSSVRLLVEGEPLEVDGADEVQDRTDWTEYDPAGVAGDAPLLFLQDRRLASLDQELGSSPVTRGDLPVDEAALSPATGRLAVRTRTAAGDEVRTGPLAGPFGDPVLTGSGLGSLSWGPADQGLWVLQTGRATPVVWLVPGADADDPRPRRVPYVPPPGSGPLQALQVSRDGARVALVLGGRLHVGRVEPGPDGLRIGSVERVSRELVDVIDVAWQSGTSLVALGSLAAEEQPFPATVAVDGSAFAVVQRPLVGAVAAEVAAAPRRPLVVAADVDGRRQLYRDNGTLFGLQQPGRSPFYPG